MEFREKSLMEEKLDILGKILKKDSRAVAVIGTRQPSAKGRKLAHDFSFFLAGKGVTIISGMARGIDSIAHRAAIEAAGRTIAVLGSGLDTIYPPENKDLFKKIIKNGAVVSEFKRGTPPLPRNFLERNRFVAKLSKAVLVIEGKRRSGTLSTANWAANMGIEVFAIAGSPATDWLISQGASPCNSPQDVLDYLDTLKGKKKK